MAIFEVNLSHNGEVYAVSIDSEELTVSEFHVLAAAAAGLEEKTLKIFLPQGKILGKGQPWPESFPRRMALFGSRIEEKTLLSEMERIDRHVSAARAKEEVGFFKRLENSYGDFGLENYLIRKGKNATPWGDRLLFYVPPFEPPLEIEGIKSLNNYRPVPPRLYLVDSSFRLLKRVTLAFEWNSFVLGRETSPWETEIFAFHTNHNEYKTYPRHFLYKIDFSFDESTFLGTDADPVNPCQRFISDAPREVLERSISRELFKADKEGNVYILDSEGGKVRLYLQERNVKEEEELEEQDRLERERLEREKRRGPFWTDSRAVFLPGRTLELEETTHRQRNVYHFVIDSRKNLILFSGDTFTVTYYDVSQGQPILKYSIPTFRFTRQRPEFYLLPDDRLFLAGHVISPEGKIIHWHQPTPEENVEDLIPTFSFSPEGRVKIKVYRKFISDGVPKARLAEER